VLTPHLRPYWTEIYIRSQSHHCMIVLGGDAEESGLASIPILRCLRELLREEFIFDLLRKIKLSKGGETMAAI